MGNRLKVVLGDIESATLGDIAIEVYRNLALRARLIFTFLANLGVSNRSKELAHSFGLMGSQEKAGNEMILQGSYWPFKGLEFVFGCGVACRM